MVLTEVVGKGICEKYAVFPHSDIRNLENRVLFYQAVSNPETYKTPSEHRTLQTFTYYLMLPWPAVPRP